MVVVHAAVETKRMNDGREYSSLGTSLGTACFAENASFTFSRASV